MRDMRQNFLKLPKQITVKWDGPEPLVLPNKRSLPPGESTLPIEVWHSLGGDPRIGDFIASGALSVVHRRHEFAEGDDHCIGCSLTREEAEAERVARAKPKAAPAPAGDRQA